MHHRGASSWCTATRISWLNTWYTFTDAFFAYGKNNFSSLHSFSVCSLCSPVSHAAIKLSLLCVIFSTVAFYTVHILLFVYRTRRTFYCIVSCPIGYDSRFFSQTNTANRQLFILQHLFDASVFFMKILR